MDLMEQRLAEEIRKHAHVYDSSSPHYKDSQMIANSWEEISTTIGLDVIECTKRWRTMRDKYVRLRKRLSTQSGDPLGHKVPSFYVRLSWLAPHVKHRERGSTNYGTNSPQPSPRSPCQKMRPKRNRKEQDDCLQKQVAQLKERRVELQQREDSGCSDELQPSPLSPCQKMSPKRKEQDDCLQKQVAQLKECRVELQLQRLDSGWSDELQSSPLSPCQKMTPKMKRKEQDDCLQKQVAKLEERRVELQQQRQDSGCSDELSRFGQTVTDMLRRLPEEHRPQAMFDVYKLLFERQQQNK